MKINFEKFPCYTNITKQEKKDFDVRFQLSNTLYQRGSGIVMGALALKIYNSKGEEEYSEQECNILLNFVKESFAPLFIESLEEVINKK